MFRGVPIAHPDVPNAPAHYDRLAVFQSVKPNGKRRHAICKIERPRILAACHKPARPFPQCAVKRERLGGWHIMRIKRQHSRHQPSGARHVKRRTLLHETNQPGPHGRGDGG